MALFLVTRPLTLPEIPSIMRPLCSLTDHSGMMARTALLAVALLSACRSASEIDDFPYPLIEAPGSQVILRWEELNRAPDTTPVIIGSREDVLRLSETIAWHRDEGATVEEILAAADALTHPASIDDLRDREAQLAYDFLLEEDIFTAEELAESEKEDAEEEAWLLNAPWPRQPFVNPGLLSLDDYVTGEPLDTVYIAVVPTDDPTEFPAYLFMGGWNENPPAEYHVAAFRSWRDRYGAVPVVMSSEIVEFRVERPPEDRDAALALAVEQFRYCSDIVHQGAGTLPALAASLAVSDWWYFWWD